MTAKGSQKKAPPAEAGGSAYQNEINSWSQADLESKLLECERNLHLNLPQVDKRQEIFRTIAAKWLPATPDRDGNGLPINIDKDDFDRMKVNERRVVDICGIMLARAEAMEISKQETTDINGDKMTFERRIRRFKACYKTIVRMFVENDEQYRVFNDPLAENCEVDFDLEKDASPYQKLLLYLLKRAYAEGFRRYRDQCCREIRNTRAWRPIKEIKDFVYDETQKEDNHEMWMNLTNRGNMTADVVRHLSNCKDIQFYEIKKDRHVWSFQNGLLDSRPIEENRCPVTRVRKFRFYDYRSTEFKELDPTLVSCKYFDQPFDPYEDVEDWWDIPTPHMQCVLDYQKFDEDVARWMYVFCGRLCFDVNELDGWQVIPFLKGIARSGKSTIITKVCRKFYECEDVSTLSNNIEKKFGLWSIYNGFMFISPEVKGDLQLEQAEFQSLVSGEDVSVARKNEKALSMQWKTPGILGGNEVPNWKDNSGSILRRLATWNFAKQVADADPHLEDKLELEIPAILCKCLRAYLEYAHKYADKDIWNVLPQYFKTIQSQVATVTNTLQHFLASEKCNFGPDLFVPMRVFTAQFHQHCKENFLGTTRFNEDVYAGPFSSRDIVVRTESVIYKGQAYTSQAVIHGIDIRDAE